MLCKTSKWWSDRINKYDEATRARDAEMNNMRVDTRRRYIQFRYTDTGEVDVIDMNDPDTFDKMFESGRPIEVMCFNRAYEAGDL